MDFTGQLLHLKHVVAVYEIDALLGSKVCIQTLLDLRI